MKNCGLKKRNEVLKLKIKIYYFSLLTKSLFKGALPSGYHTLYSPNQDRFCDWNQCTDTLLTNGKVLNCGHAYHDQYFINMGLKYLLCLEYFCIGIEELSNSYI